jgi:hypothetical protein
MSSIMKIKNTKISSDVWCGQTIEPGEYFEIPSSYRQRWAEDVKVFQDIANGNLVVNNIEEDITNPIEGYEYLEHEMAQDVVSVSEQIIDWDTMKTFFDNNKGAFLNYLESSNDYYLWLCFRSQKSYIPMLEKNTTEGLDFETNYKSRCNINAAVEARIRTCKYGRKQHCRFITLTTANQNNYDNTNYLDVDYADVTYTMIDINKVVTTNNTEAKETWIDWMPAFSYEVRGGSVYIPETLSGDLNLWEIHVVGAPDIPKIYGGSLEFLANPRIKWNRNSKIECNSELDPADVTYYPSMPVANKIRFIFKHPVGAQVEFQIHLNLYIDV